VSIENHIEKSDGSKRNTAVLRDTVALAKYVAHENIEHDNDKKCMERHCKSSLHLYIEEIYFIF